MALAKTIPPRFDCEIFTNIDILTGVSEANEVKKIEGQWNSDECDRFLVFGLSKGTIVFMEIDNIE